MALFNPYQMVGSDKYAVLENERDIPSSGNTYAIGSGPRPGYGVQPSSYGPGQGGVSYFGDAPPNPFGFAAVHPSMYGGSPGDGPATAPTTGPIGQPANLEGLKQLPGGGWWRPESENDIPSSGNIIDPASYGGGGTPYLGLGGGGTAPGAPYPGASPGGGYSLGNSSGAPAAASYWEGDTLINPAAAQPALLQPSGYNYSTGGAPVPFGYGSSAAYQPTIESAGGGGGAGGAAGGGGFFSNPAVANTLAVAPTAIGLAGKAGLLDWAKPAAQAAWNSVDFLPTWGDAGGPIPGAEYYPAATDAVTDAAPTSWWPKGSEWDMSNPNLGAAAVDAAGGFEAIVPGSGGEFAYNPEGLFKGFNVASDAAINNALGGPGVGNFVAGAAPALMAAVAAKVGQDMLMGPRGSILHTLGLIGDERDEEARLRALTVGDAVTAAARGQIPIQAAIEAISPGTDNPSNMRRLEELRSAAEATQAMQATDQRRIDAENDLRNAVAYQQTQNLNTISEIEQLEKQGVLDSKDEKAAVAKMKADLMASAGLSGIETSEIEKYKQKASQYRNEVTSGEGKWPALARAQKEYKQAGQLAPWMKYLPVDLQKEVMSSRVAIQEGDFV